MRLKIDNVTCTHTNASCPTLNGVSMTLEGGTLSAIIGSSGAGKSTLLRCLTGLEPFERGRVALDNVILNGSYDVTNFVRRKQLQALRPLLQLVFQTFELFPHLSALNNCTLAPRLVKRLSAGAAETRALAIMAELGLEAQAQFFPQTLSGGQRQRVAIARALMMEPRVLLYDEPTSALDASLKNEVAQTLRRVAAMNVTQVVVTHDITLAKTADWVAVLDRGVVVEQGVATSVLKNPQHARTQALLDAWH